MRIDKRDSHRQMTVAGRIISDDTPCYVIAEVGHNHQGDLDLCRTIFKAAADAGADCVKLQKRSNRSLFTREAYDRVYNSENSYGLTYGEHREFLEFGREEYEALFAYARELGLQFMSTAFDFESLDFLVDLGIDAIKIASGDIVNLPLIQAAAATGIPLIMSTGAATMENVIEAYEMASQGKSEIAILQCTSSYPADYEQLNIAVIETYRDAFPGTVIGFSAHDNGTSMPLLAYAMGCRIVEKHFTTNRTLKGTDQIFSLAPSGMRRMCRDLARAHVAIGDGNKVVYDTELTPMKKQRKSVVANRNMPAGTVLARADLALKIPNEGLPPKRLFDLVGRTLATDIKEDEYLSDGHLN